MLFYVKFISNDIRDFVEQFGIDISKQGISIGVKNKKEFEEFQYNYIIDSLVVAGI